MQSKTIGKIIVDLGMTVLLMLLMAFERIGRTAHEWIGAGMFVLFNAPPAGFCLKQASPRSAQNGTGVMLFIILFYSAISALSRSKIASSAFQKYAVSPRSTVMPVRSK